jgi:hypothetical protein
MVTESPVFWDIAWLRRYVSDYMTIYNTHYNHLRVKYKIEIVTCLNKASFFFFFLPKLNVCENYTGSTVIFHESKDTHLGFSEGRF